MMFQIPFPETQIGFSAALSRARVEILQDALRCAVSGLSIPTIDRELAELVPEAALARLATQGLRGEIAFPVPAVLKAAPRLLGYYRLLYGFSQKEFYTARTGVGRFKSMETRGRIAPSAFQH
jgi:hypothetical protein